MTAAARAGPVASAKLPPADIRARRDNIAISPRCDSTAECKRKQAPPQSQMLKLQDWIGRRKGGSANASCWLVASTLGNVRGPEPRPSPNHDPWFYAPARSD